jgi:transcriptional regulator with XRE-family HTH domain
MEFREALGEVLREQRLAQGKTLRQVSKASCVALGYLSEIERGHKEASSIILSALSNGLGVPAHEIVFKTALRMAGLDVPDTLADLPTDEYADLGSNN